eukprot:TRINITY_DN12046_c0_g1_i6.p1 TRINITY_DN12046_c0_g1~~TRINITY_DN12046_c0_g1_i6.p1  ORF type:complete len:522 (+),score=64.34 TRINITY_DN12046_c0_g1_i6:1057-2622(+)
MSTMVVTLFQSKMKSYLQLHALILTTFLPSSIAYANSRPNIVLINADDVGYGIFAHPTSPVPNIERLKNEGAHLLEYYSAANICSPSRGALLTGRLFRRLGIYPGVFSPLSNGGLQLNETTIPAALRTVGYTTGGLGKWHLGVDEYHPIHHGFDAYYGVPMTQNECVSNIHTPGSATANGPFGPCPLYNGTTTVIKEQGQVDMIDIDNFYDHSAIDFMSNASRHSTPFFFYFASHHTHAPQFAPSEMTGVTRRGLYGDSLATLDRSVGRILNFLDDSGLSNNTLVIFTADNGASLQWQELGGVNGLFRCGKGTTWEGGHRVPTAIRWTGVIPPYTRVEDMTSALDWFHTFSTLTGYTIPTDRTYDGMDMSPCLFEGKPCQRDQFFYHSTKVGGPVSQPGAVMAVRAGPYKLHMYTQGSHCNNDYSDQECRDNHTLTNHSGVPLLYNVERDPGEVVLLTQDTYGEFNQTHTYNDVVASLVGLYHRHIDSFVSMPSEIAKGSSAERFPCCDDCSPKPHCCQCN